MSGENNNRVPESIVVKLFDQTKEASNQNAERIKDLTRAVDDLTRFLEKQPDLKEMRDDVKCLLGKVKTMIVVVIVAFGLMTMSYFYVRSHVDNMVKRAVENVVNVEDGSSD